jgi:hypothetical protein
MVETHLNRLFQPTINYMILSAFHQKNIIFRCLHLFFCRPTFAVSGDIYGGINVWNLDEKCLDDGIDLGKEQEGYRHQNAVVSMDEVSGNE